MLKNCKIGTSKKSRLIQASETGNGSTSCSARCYVLGFFLFCRMPDQSVRLPEKKWNDILPSNRANREEMALTIFYSLTEFPTIVKSTEEKSGNEPVWQYGMANFGPTGPTDQSEPLSWVVPNIPVGPNRNGPCHLTFNRSYWNLWHNGKHPLEFSARLLLGNMTSW